MRLRADFFSLLAEYECCFSQADLSKEISAILKQLQSSEFRTQTLLYKLLHYHQFLMRWVFQQK